MRQRLRHRKGNGIGPRIPSDLSARRALCTAGCYSTLPTGRTDTAAATVTVTVTVAVTATVTATAATVTATAAIVTASLWSLLL